MRTETSISEHPARKTTFFIDEIGSVLKIKQYRNERRELLESIETYYRIVFLGERLEEE